MPGQRGEPERLQKVLARAGLASRREAEEWIRAGRLTVNGRAAALGVRVGPEDEVRLDGRVIRQRAPHAGGRAYLYHRSPGESLDRAPAESPDALPLLARLPKRAGRRFIVVSPMPRIDGGLEIVCGDGELASRLQRSVHALASELSVRVRGELTGQQIEGVLGGVLDSGEKVTVLGCQAAGGEGANRWYAVTTRGASGKDVRQLFERQGAIVSRVLRTRLGPLALERSLGRGHFRELEREEIGSLMSQAAGGTEPQAPDAVETPARRGGPRHPKAPARRDGSTRPEAPARRKEVIHSRPPVRRGSAHPQAPARGRSRGAPGAKVRRRGPRE